MPKNPEQNFNPEAEEKVVEKTKEQSGSGWLTENAAAIKLGVDHRRIKELSAKQRQTNPAWFDMRKTVNGVLREHFAPELIDVMDQEIKAFDEKYKNWVMPVRLAEELKVPKFELIEAGEKHFAAHPEWFDTFRYGRGPVTEHYSPELAEILRKEFGEEPPAGWMVPSRAYRSLGAANYKDFIATAEQQRSVHPEWFRFFKPKKSKRAEHYSPELIEHLRAGLKVEKERLDQYDFAPEGWITQGAFTAKTGIDSRILAQKLEPYRKSNPDWLKDYVIRGPQNKRGPVREHMSPELAEVLTGQLEEEGYALGKRQKALETELGQTLTSEIEHFRKMVSIFGAARAVDVLYINHPKYKSIPVGRVKSIIADYLGEFLVIRHQFGLDDLEAGVKFLGDQTLKEGLYEVMKDACLTYYHQQKKANPQRDDIEIIREYAAKIRSETAAFSNEDLVGVIEQVEAYYVSLFEGLTKPERVVDFVKEGREFPDANQLVNIKEIQEKKKMLIADEMGLGKSGSVIMAKEYLGLKQALVVVPSNVMDTWQNYLSDKVGEDGSQLGYFKKDQVPKVLVVDSVNDIRDKDLSSYEYILISQEKLNDIYIKELAAINYDMLIVDEVHKLKNLTEGERAQNIISLAQKVEGDNKYLALLSGTPVPNKVEDVAMILKLLYPERFEEMDNKVLVKSIIRGDLVDLRTLLVPRMQMKSLEANVEMPQLTSEFVEVELTQLEKDIYEVLMEEDEMTAPQKIRIMRQFLLNPELLDSTPGVESAKIKQLREELQEVFKTKDKVVMFVNGYIEGVIRGDKTIFEQLGLPSDVEVMVIEGDVSKTRRIEIQKQLKQSNKKILLAVSGQTADVGVDFTGGESVYFYNEPWTKYDKLQQLARVYRPGLENDLTSRTLMARNTIEEGIRRYIEAKHKSIEKLLRGIPLTELEQKMLKTTEVQRDPNLEVNPELAEYYFTSWDRLMKIFSEVKEIGEQSFTEYLNQYGREYADCYLELGSRSYQANGSRLVGTVISRLVKENKQNPSDIKILDIASGPEMLKRHINERLQKSIVSIDINEHHFGEAGENRIVGSFGKLPVQSNSLDYANLSLALHYTKFLPTRREFERVEVLAEMNRVLKEGGKGVINLIYSLDLKDEEAFQIIVDQLGFKIVNEYSGTVSSGSGYLSRVITLEKVRNVEGSVEDLVGTMEKETLEGLKLKNTKRNLKDTKKIIETFRLGEKNYKIEFNAEDDEVYKEEKKVLEAGKVMKEEYGAIQNIPKDIIVEFNFVRFFDGRRYILFRKLEKGRGIVVIR